MTANYENVPQFLERFRCDHGHKWLALFVPDVRLAERATTCPMCGDGKQHGPQKGEQTVVHASIGCCDCGQISKVMTQIDFDHEDGWPEFRCTDCSWRGVDEASRLRMMAITDAVPFPWK